MPIYNKNMENFRKETLKLSKILLKKSQLNCYSLIQQVPTSACFVPSTVSGT